MSAALRWLDQLPDGAFTQRRALTVEDVLLSFVSVAAGEAAGRVSEHHGADCGPGEFKRRLDAAGYLAEADLLWAADELRQALDWRLRFTA